MSPKLSPRGFWGFSYIWSDSLRIQDAMCNFELLKLSWIDLNWFRSLLQSDRTQKKPQREGEIVFRCCYSNNECIWEFKDDRWPILTFYPQTLTLHQSWKRQTWQSILLFSPGCLLSPTLTATSSPTDMRTVIWRYQEPWHFLERHQTFINMADLFFFSPSRLIFLL